MLSRVLKSAQPLQNLLSPSSIHNMNGNKHIHLHQHQHQHHLLPSPQPPTSTNTSPSHNHNRACSNGGQRHYQLTMHANADTTQGAKRREGEQAVRGIGKDEGAVRPGNQVRPVLFLFLYSILIICIFLLLSNMKLSPSGSVLFLESKRAHVIECGQTPPQQPQPPPAPPTTSISALPAYTAANATQIES